MKLALGLFLVVMMMLVPSMVQAEQSDEYVVTVFMAESWTDQGWNMAHKRGFDELKGLGPILEEWDSGFVVELTDLPYDTLRINFVTQCGYGSEIESMMRSGIAIQQPDMVFGTWFNSYQAVQSLAPEFPEVIFNHCSSYPEMKSSDFSTKNVSTYFIKQCLSDYIVGVVTGEAGYNRVGFVATIAIPEPIRAVNAFALGLQAGYNGETEVNAVWLDSWLDVEQEYQASQSLVDAGYSVIRQLPDTPTVSVVACENGAVALGYGTNTLPTAPCTLITNEWVWEEYYKECVLAGMNGDWQPHDWFEPRSNLVVNPNAPPELLEIANAVDTARVWTGPISGHGWDINGNPYRVFVPEGEMLTDMDILTMSWFVDGVITSKKPLTPEARLSRFIVD